MHAMIAACVSGAGEGANKAREVLVAADLERAKHALKIRKDHPGPTERDGNQPPPPMTAQVDRLAQLTILPT
jgi:hypothetical protein